jgi:hypothetical protein
MADDIRRITPKRSPVTYRGEIAALATVECMNDYQVTPENDREPTDAERERHSHILANRIEATIAQFFEDVATGGALE